jgi:putative intracellular protease/amidase
MPGAERLRDCDKLTALLREQQAAGRLYAAICAAPAVVFEHHKLLEGLPATCHPAFVDKLADSEYASHFCMLRYTSLFCLATSGINHACMPREAW